MSRDNLGNKQTIIIHNCLINDDKYDLVITPHRQPVGYIKTKSQALRKKIINKQKQIIRKTFKTKKRCLRIRNNRNTRTSQFKRLKKQKPST